MRIDRVFKVGGCRAIPYERKIIEMHPLMGSDILNKISREINNDVISSLEVAENIILHHHEKWDGTGYPHRLKGEEIPLEARIVAIVGVFDALTSKRPYKDSWSVERALSFINEQKGKHFDPSIVMSFFCYFDEKAAQKKRLRYGSQHRDMVNCELVAFWIWSLTLGDKGLTILEKIRSL
ncbi:hypothetical protein DOZ91_11120 [Peribacillus frigoritolerans]|nr:hypothetical protein DOZ91_11120 [Peribacillus frigoritolerans]